MERTRNASDDLRLTAKTFGELDALRGLCALCVALFHYTLIYPVRFGPPEGFGFEVLIGHLGPHLFFVISGFAMWMSTESRRSIVEFAWTRFLRLFPGYWFAVCLTFLLIQTVQFPDHPRNWFQFAVNLTMLQDFLGVLTLDAAYWSLAVELVFYAWIAGILLLRLRPWIEWLVFTWLALGGCVAVEWLPWVLPNGYPFPIPWWMRPTLTSSFMLVVLALTHTPRRVLAWDPLLFLGRISYAFYLVHTYTGFTVILGLAAVGLTGPEVLLPALLASGLVAWFITDCIERPLQRYRTMFRS